MPKLVPPPVQSDEEFSVIVGMVLKQCGSRYGSISRECFPGGLLWLHRASVHIATNIIATPITYIDFSRSYPNANHHSCLIWFKFGTGMMDANTLAVRFLLLFCPAACNRARHDHAFDFPYVSKANQPTPIHKLCNWLRD